MKTSHLSDEKLVELVRTKDQELYAEVVRRYQDKLLRYATRICGDEHLASDAVQQAFIKAFKNLNSFKTNKKFSSWLYRIAHNEAINLIKKENKAFSISDWLAESLPATDKIETDTINKLEAERVSKCLSSLSLKYRSVLNLYYLEEKSYQEISEILRLPTSTVGVRLKRGKLKLQQICQK